MTGRWSIGTLVGLPIAAIIVIALLVLAGVALYGREKGIGGKFLALALGIALFTGWAMYPWQARYHRWEPKTGTVESVNKRLISDGDKSMSERFVVRWRGADGEYGCDDTRCALVRPGDRLTLLCKREWQYAGVDGWACNFGRVVKAARRGAHG